MFQWSNLVIVALTQKCNLNCKYCFLGDKSTLPETSMNFKTFKKIIDKIVSDFQKSGRKTSIQILLHGGEPLLLEASLLDKMLTYAEATLSAYSIPYRLSIQTNGINLTSTYIEILKEHNVEIGVSIDSVIGNLRASTSLNQTVLNNIENAKNADTSIGTNTVITKDNLDTALYDIGNTLPSNLRSTKVFAVEDCYPDQEYSPSAKEYFEEVIKPSFYLYLEGKEYPAGMIDRSISRYVFYKCTIHSYDECHSTCQFKYCGASVNLVSIMPDGRVRLCDHWRGDEDFYDPIVSNVGDYDFLNLNQLNALVKWINYLDPYYKKCDNCLLADYCVHPCPLLKIKRNNNKLENCDFSFNCELTKLMFDFYEKNLSFIIDSLIEHRRGIVQCEEMSAFQSSYNPDLQDYRIAIKNEHVLEISHV